MLLPNDPSLTLARLKSASLRRVRRRVIWKCEARNEEHSNLDCAGGRRRCLLIAAVGAILALLAGHARLIEVAWVSIAASLFVLA
jgi:hypothetical protein